MTIRIFFAGLLILPAIAMASVNTKNGNFYISYTDIQQKSDAKSGEHVLELTRTYNSKASGIGWFGFGWGTPFEAGILVMPDGSVIVHENGGSGRDEYYAPKDGRSLQGGVAKIVAVAIQRDKLDADAADALRKQLLSNEDLRRSSVVKYDIKSQLPTGGVARSSPCDAITRINDEYQRIGCDNSIDTFDLSGRLIRKEEGGYKILLHYTGKYPDRIEDSLGQKIFLKWTAAGHVADARTDKAAPIIHYFYDEKDNLLMSNEFGAYAMYRYEYDINHNLTRIGYLDNTHMDMQYDEKSLITSVTEPDGAKSTYAYRIDSNNPSHFWTTTTLTGTSGEQSSRVEEYSLAADAAGVEKIASLTRTSDGNNKKEIIWDERGRVKRIQNDEGGFSEFTYHQTLGKVRSVLTENGKTKFFYNKFGQLISAKNSHGLSVKLGYDTRKHISRMVEINRSRHTIRKLELKYNDMGKLIKINLIGKGEVSVAYDAQGEITEVKSKQGIATASSVSQAFQSLLEVVKVAGVGFGG